MCECVCVCLGCGELFYIESITRYVELPSPPAHLLVFFRESSLSLFSLFSLSLSSLSVFLFFGVKKNVRGGKPAHQGADTLNFPAKNILAKSRRKQVGNFHILRSHCPNF